VKKKIDLPIILTMGEPSGIGGEIALKAWQLGHTKLSPFCIIDCPNRLQQISNSMNLQVDVVEIARVEDTATVFEKALPVLPIRLPGEIVPGELNSLNNQSVLLAIKRATKLIQSGRAIAMVTNPIHKNILYQSGFSYPGHTEYIAALAKIKTEPVMMLVSDRLRVIPVTRHVGLQKAIKMLEPKLIVKTALIANEALKKDFRISNPRIAIAALNPHAGEGGMMGDEEETFIYPAITILKEKGLSVMGPAPPDTLFHNEARQNYDVVLCMYHDQALIPIKTLDFESAVNVTLGLPFIRTSPDHGTALNIAGKGCANEQSLVAAIRIAGKMADTRLKTSSL